MVIASIVLGLISAVVAVLVSFIPIPYLGMLVFLPSLIGLILGAIGSNKLKKNSEPNDLAVIGVGLNTLTLIIVLGTSIMTTLGRLL